MSRPYKQYSISCVSSMLAYLAVFTTSPRPLSKVNFVDWNILSRDRLVDLLCHALRAIGLDTSQFNRHSFRIGTATTVAKAGLQDYRVAQMSD